jgi:hypothetical protein
MTQQPMGRADGPVFISYRHEGGARDAEFIDVYLRTGGIVPWRDKHDLKTGEITSNIEQAFEDGLSGGILLVTDGIEESPVIAGTEVPLMVKAYDNTPDSFQLHIINTIGKPNACNFDAPKEKLREAKCPVAHRLDNRKLQRKLLRPWADQEAVSELPDMLRDLLRSRIKACRDGQEKEIRIGVQTRFKSSYMPADNQTSSEADLHIRLRQNSATQIPEELDYRCLQQALPILINEIREAGFTRVLVRGGCHPSLAWALGAALPEAREVEFIWHDTHGGNEWSSTGKPAEERRTSVRLSTLESDGMERDLGFAPDSVPSSVELRQALWGDAPAENAVVLLAADGYDPAPLKALVDSLDGSAVLIINLHTPSTADGKGRINHAEGAVLARSVGDILRNLYRISEDTKLHLAVSAPVAMAALVARCCNTVVTDFYDYGHTGVNRHGYIRVLRTEPGNSFPITGVFPQGVPRVNDVRKLINLTPHAVTYCPEAGEPFTWLAPTEQSEELPSPLQVKGCEIPVRMIRQGVLNREPDVLPGAGYIVPRIVAQKARRPDFFFPHDEVRDEGGNIRGFRRLGCFEPVSDASLPYLDFLEPVPED